MKSNKQTIFAILGAILVVFLLGMIVVSVTALQPAAQAQAVAPAAAELPRTITVVGEGKMITEPDIAYVTVGVETMGDSVQTATAEAADIMEAVMSALKKEGIVQKDMQTSGYNVWVDRPYGPMPMTEMDGIEPEAASVVYRVNNNLQVVVRDLDTLSDVLGAGIDAGANNIYGINFSLSERDEPASEARAKAVDDARAKAEELAALNGESLGQVLSVSEIVGGGGGYYASNFARMASVAEGMGGGGPISPGQLDLTVQLQVTYAIK